MRFCRLICAPPCRRLRLGLLGFASHPRPLLILKNIEEKGHVKHRREGLRYVHLPTQGKDRASRSALRRVVSTFFGGSAPQAVAALLEDRDTQLSREEIDQLQSIIDQAKKEGR